MLLGFSLYVLLVCVPQALCGEHPDGTSQVSRSQDVLGNYKFDYTVSNSEGGQFRREGTDELGRVVGSYGLSLGDGRERVVDYIADKNGFRAHVRSNEPGVASSESDAVTIEKTDHPQSSHLDAAATSHNEDDGRAVYGKRLKTTASRVSYVESDTGDASKRVAPQRPDAVARESRQRHIEDYIPGHINPTGHNVQYSNGPFRPADFDDIAGPRIRPPILRANLKPPETYLPPIDPHTAVRRPVFYLPRDRSSARDYYPTTTSRRPFIPPYGGFDDEPILKDRRPVSMTTIHGGLGQNPYLPPPTPSTIYGAGRYPNDVPPIRNYGISRYPNAAIPNNGYGVPHPPGSVLPLQPRPIYAQSPLLPPFNNNGNSPNVVIRAVPIPNGIQAVRVDPSSGRVLERLVYPLYLRYNNNPNYDRDILLHNDDVSDDIDGDRDILRNYDIPLRRRLALRGASEQPSDGDYEENKQYNRSYVIDEKSLSKPTARDMALIQRQLEFINGFRNPSNRVYGSSDDRPLNPEAFEFDEFQDSEGVYGRVRNDDREFSPYSADEYRSDHPNTEEFARYLRGSESRRLSPADSKQIALASLERSSSETKDTKAEVGRSEIEKE